VTKVLVMLHKRTDQSWDEFQRYWRETHGPIAARIPGLRSYVQNHANDRGNVPYAVAELYFDSPEALQEALATPAGQAALGDLGNFVDGERTGMTVVEEARIV
jgi:uncharacterized protein (TIGR02118 family)